MSPPGGWELPQPQQHLLNLSLTRDGGFSTSLSACLFSRAAARKISQLREWDLR